MINIYLPSHSLNAFQTSRSLVMYYYQKFAILGFLLSLVPLLFGIIALTTPSWIVINDSQLSNRSHIGLFGRCKGNQTRVAFQTPQYLQISGYIILVIGVFAAVLCTTFFDKRRIHFIAPILILIGSVTIFLGLICYLQSVIEDLPNSSNIQFQFGYSLILMLITAIVGCISTAYFSYTAGYIHRHILSNIDLH